MAHESFLSFNVRMSRAGVEINDSLVTQATKHQYERPFAGDDWRSAIYAAGLLLNSAPVMPLVNESLTKHEVTGGDALSVTTMIHILNQSRSRTWHPNWYQSDRWFHNQPAREVGACHVAEELFSGVLTRMLDTEINSGDYEGPGWTLLSDGRNVIGIQKLEGEEHSVLGLEALTVDDITYPAGMLYGVDMPEGFRTDNDQRLKLAGSRVVGLLPSRLTPWAFSAENRLREFPRLMPDLDSIFLKEWDITDIRALAQDMLPETMNSVSAPMLVS